MCVREKKPTGFVFHWHATLIQSQALWKLWNLTWKYCSIRMLNTIQQILSWSAEMCVREKKPAGFVFHWLATLTQGQALWKLWNLTLK